MSRLNKFYGVLLFILGCLLIANGGVMFDLTLNGGIVVTGEEAATTIDGTAVKVKTEDEKKALKGSREVFVQVMSAISIIAGVAMWLLTVFFFQSKDRQQDIQQAIQKFFRRNPDNVSGASDASTVVSAEGNPQGYPAMPGAVGQPYPVGGGALRSGLGMATQTAMAPSFRPSMVEMEPSMSMVSSVPPSMGGSEFGEN